MKIKIVAVAILMFATVSACQGQVVSGFKGKKTWIGVKMGAFPVPTSNGLVNSGVSAGIDFVTRNYMSFSAQVIYGSNHKELGEDAISGNYTSSKLGNFSASNTQGTFQTTELGADLGFKFYRKRRGSLAPLGKHLDMGVKIKQVTFNYENMIVGGYRGSDFDFQGEYFYTAIVPYLGMGWEKVISDNMLFHLGFITELDLNSLLATETSGGDMGLALHTEMKRRNANYGLLRINFGIKYAL